MPIQTMNFTVNEHLCYMSIFVDNLRRFLALMLVAALAACGGGGSSSDSGGGSNDDDNSPLVKVSGTINYTRIPAAADGFGLDYGNAVDQPARGVMVEALSGSDAVLASTVTDENGAYSFSVAANTDVKVRAKAQLLKTGTPAWDVTVTDNTSGNSPYFLTGALANSGTEDSGRDLLAASGWGGSSYTSQRAAAPFAILDTVYSVQQVFLAAQPNAVLAPLQLRWSENNKSDNGLVENGDIGTSFYDIRERAIYILGFENNDTDEYDESVVAHEWWHYAEDALLRSENLGGPHGSGDRLDMRVAFSEGTGNAWSAVVNGSPLYADSGGESQGQGFSFSLETNNVINPGWYSEGSVQSIFYDLLDGDGADDENLSLTPAAVINALATEHKQSPAFASIYTFINAVKSQNSANAFEIDQLVTAQDINASADAFGSGETNSAGNTKVLPVYSTLTVDSSTSQNVCSINSFGTINKLGNYRFLRISIANAAAYQITVTRSSGLQPSDPDFAVYRSSELIVLADSSGTGDSEQATVELTPGEYVMDLVEFRNVGESGGGETCFDVSIATQ